MCVQFTVLVAGFTDCLVKLALHDRSFPLFNPLLRAFTSTRAFTIFRRVGRWSKDLRRSFARNGGQCGKREENEKKKEKDPVETSSVASTRINQERYAALSSKETKRERKRKKPRSYFETAKLFQRRVLIASFISRR